LQRLAPSLARNLQISNGFAGVQHENMIVIHLPDGSETLAKTELSLQSL